MIPDTMVFTASLAILACAAAPPAIAQTHEHQRMHMQAQQQGQAQSGDKRQTVKFPAALREHELANMRDHLSTLAQIQAALARHDMDAAAALAERRLGMSSFELHGAHEVAKYMPKGMQEIGTGMHRAASRFALEATSAGATGDLRPALAALAQVTQQCVACHATYRLE